MSTKRAFSQKIDNVHARHEGSKIIVTYDILEAGEDKTFDVSVYCSFDQYSVPLKRVTGAIGRQSYGVGKAIEWDFKTELQSSYEDLTFEVRAKIIPEFKKFVFKSPTVKSVKRGATMQISWTGGRSEEQIKFHLYKQGVEQSVIAETKNTGAYLWKVPARLKKGQYNLKITGASDEVLSTAFFVRPKLPLAIKVIPIAALGSALFLMGSRGGNSGPDELPVPFDPN